MTSGSRRIHLFIWGGLILITPIIMLIAIKNKPHDAIGEPLISPSELTDVTISSLEEVAFSKERNQLEIVIIRPLKSASTLVYEIENGKKGNLIGEIAGSNLTYSFQISSEAEGFLLYDEIRKELILKQQF